MSELPVEQFEQLQGCHLDRSLLVRIFIKSGLNDRQSILHLVLNNCQYVVCGVV